VQQATESGQRKKGGRKALWAAVALVAIVAAGLTGYKITLERTIAAQLEKRGGKAASVQADFLGKIHLRDVTLPVKGGSDLHIAAVDARPKFLFLTGMLNVSGIDTQYKNYRISVPKLTVDDADFSISTLKDTFGNPDLTPAERVARFSAKRVSAPEIDLVQDFAGNPQKIVYKDVKAEDIVHGHIAHYSAGGMDLNMIVNVPREGGGTTTDHMTGTMGLAEGKDLDAVFLTRVYTEKAGPDDRDAKLVSGPSSVKNIAFKSSELNFSYDEVSSGSLSMRLPEVPLSELTDKIGGVVRNPDHATPAQWRDYIVGMVSFLDMFGKADMQVTGLKIDPVDDAKGKSTIDRMTVSIDDRKMNFAVKGFIFNDKENHIKADDFGIDGFSWATTADAAKKLAALDDTQVQSFPFATAIPEIGTIHAADVDLDVPDPDDKGAEPSQPKKRMKFAAKNLLFILKKPYNGIPSDIHFVYDDVTIPFPADDKDEDFAALRKFGYDRLTFSSDIAASWDQAKSNLVIKNISLNVKDMFDVSFSGLVGGFGKEFFSGDKVMTQVALLGLKAQEVKLRVENKGLFDKFIADVAAKHGVKQEDEGKIVALSLSTIMQQNAPGQQQVQQVAAALGQFVAKPNILELTAKAKSPNGIGALQMITAYQNPWSLLDLVDLSAKAE